jgi:CDP-4-dehydro-6-deoxyglucose reductase
VLDEESVVRVSVANSPVSFSVAPEQTVLDAALRAGLKLPHGCNGGNCGACRARLKSGTVSYPLGTPPGLSAAEAAEGLILLCQARAREDLSIETFPVSTPDSATIKRLPCRIEHTQRWSHDVLGVFLRLPVAEPFPFAPGQYLDVMLSGGRRRSFSIASPPHDARLLELHVRRVTGGVWTEPLFAELVADPARKPLLSIEGPLGQFVYRADTCAPMLLVGGGTGLAPLKSILRHVIENDLGRDLTLYWGVRSERDLYAHAELEALAARAANLRYRAVLSEAGPDWRGRRGWVHDAVRGDLGSLAGYDIYASGPPAMIAAIRGEFPRCGADAERLFFDSFDYAPDTLERQRKMAASKS